jgi:sugar phosphate isomerase/epimerase
MRLEVYKSLWGMSGALDDDLARIGEAGYDGFEYDLPDPDGVGQLREARRRHDLKYLTLIRTEGPDHLASFRALLERAAPLEPDLITSSSADDSMTHDEARRFFEGAFEVQSTFDIPVAHETHRQTALFTPWDTAAIVAELPELRLTADYSHWCCVAERMLADQDASTTHARPRTRGTWIATRAGGETSCARGGTRTRRP